MEDALVFGTTREGYLLEEVGASFGRGLHGWMDQNNIIGNKKPTMLTFSFQIVSNMPKFLSPTNTNVLFHVSRWQVYWCDIFY
jgi:fibronectin type 3 domain-containing protein